MPAGFNFQPTNTLLSGVHVNLLFGDYDTMTVYLHQHLSGLWTLSGWRISGLAIEFEPISNSTMGCYVTYHIW